MKTLILPATVTTIQQYAFMDTSLEVIELPAALSIIESTYDEGTFNSFYLKEIRLSSDNRNFCIKDGILYTKDMTKLVRCPSENPLITGRYEIPQTVEEIYPGAFFYTSDITDLVVNNTVKIIGYDAFSGCIFESITIYKTTNYSRLGSWAHFKNVIIQDDYYRFDAYDLFGSSCKIDNLWVHDTTPPIISNVDGWNNDIKKKAVLYVPKGCKDAYSLAYSWGDFNTIKEF